MKAAAIIMVVVLICAIGASGYLFMTCRISVDAVGASTLEASVQQQLFDELKAQLDRGSVIGIRNGNATITSDSSDYQFITYTVRLDNQCFISADMIELRITMRDGDVLQIGDQSAKRLPSHSKGDIQATILSGSGSNSVREITVSYYIWGIPFMLTTRTR